MAERPPTRSVIKATEREAMLASLLFEPNSQACPCHNSARLTNPILIVPDSQASEKAPHVVMWKKSRHLSFWAKRRISLGLFARTWIEERFFASLKMTAFWVFPWPVKPRRKCLFTMASSGTS